MRNYLRNLAQRIAPTAYTRLRRLSVLDDSKSAADILVRYEDQLKDFKMQLDEVRREHRRVVELYDVMFERLQVEKPLREN